MILRLDRRFLFEELLPELFARWFGEHREPRVLVAIASADGLLFRSEPRLAAARYQPGDITVPLFGLRRLEGLHNLAPGPFPGPLPGFGPLARPHREGHPPRHHGFTGPVWKLVITHRDGSLEEAVATVRRRNLAMSFGVLAILGASLAVVGLSARRAHRLARRQLELVAGITHELNTPLAAIRSAGQNLADGVVAQGGQVKRYGALIEKEGARLTGLVAKALELAGIESGQRIYRPEPVAVAEVFAEVVQANRFVCEERGIAVETHVPPGLPPVLVDRGALRMAVGNLVDNAVKYAAAGRFIALRAAAEKGGRQVSLAVEDRGPGIPAEDRPYLFEPFYRGRAVAAGSLHGSGLGLSLVHRIAQAHRGSVAFAAGAGGRGCAFTLKLPAAPRPAPARRLGEVEEELA